MNKYIVTKFLEIVRIKSIELLIEKLILAWQDYVISNDTYQNRISFWLKKVKSFLKIHLVSIQK